MGNFDWVAIYAAILATFVAVRDYRSSRNKLKVTVSFGVDADRFDEVCAVIRVMNVGNHPLILFHAGMLWEYRKVTIFDRCKHIIRFRNSPMRMGWVHGRLPETEVGYDFPKRIEPKNSADFWIPFSAIEQGSDDDRSVFVASAQDALGRNSYSKPFDMRPPSGGAVQNSTPDC